MVQILVVVATIPMRTWKTEVEQVFMRTALGHESLDPNREGKGMWLIFHKWDSHSGNTSSPKTSGMLSVRVLFSV